MFDSTDPRAAEQARNLSNARRFRKDPLGFVRWAFPWGEPDTPLANREGPEPWQADILAGIRDALAEGRMPVRVAVASGHGVGKSALVAWLVL